MTPEILDGELDRQLKAVRKGETERVVCPWHGTIVDAESGNCCVEMDEARERLAHAHLRKIQKQVAGIRNGIQSDPSIECPYCGGINRPENVTSEADWKRPGVNPYCCDSFFVGVARLAEHDGMQHLIDHARRIQDNIAKVGWN